MKVENQLYDAFCKGYTNAYAEKLFTNNEFSHYFGLYDELCVINAAQHKIFTSWKSSPTPPYPFWYYYIEDYGTFYGISSPSDKIFLSVLLDYIKKDSIVKAKYSVFHDSGKHNLSKKQYFKAGYNTRKKYYW